ncbi:MAG: hypothetical protein MZV63_31400 [Marinilabiliales bacterium]|nr:hypothetical protein [Marinilabiliales bacterium]
MNCLNLKATGRPSEDIPHRKKEEENFTNYVIKYKRGDKFFLLFRRTARPVGRILKTKNILPNAYAN